MQNKLTIFTPSYNRKYTLPRLYESLLNQTDKRFEWLIVDDGSSDGTGEYIKELIKENKLSIRCEYQANAGKSQAHNKGVELTITELFVCVDSDDYLKENAVEEILKKWEDAAADNVGILSYRIHGDGTAITRIENTSIQEFTLRDGYSRYGLKGDTMLVFRTDIVKKYRFPKFEGEKFVPETYLYDLIDGNGTLMLLRKGLYVCDYLEDGYTKSSNKLLAQNPNGVLAYLDHRLQTETSFKDKLFDLIRYIAIAKCSDKKQIIKASHNPIWAILMYPFGVVMYLKRYKKHKLGGKQ